MFLSSVWMDGWMGFVRRDDEGMRYIYIYTIYTPNLGLEIAVPGQERERGCFKGSSEGAQRRSKGALREREGIGGSRGLY